MTLTLTAPAATAPRRARTRHYVMCPPDAFEVVYAINPWMDPTAPVDRALARRQWDGLVAVYRRLGHRVDVLDAVPGLPDMVFAANGAVSVGRRTYGASFAFAQRQPEARWHADFLRSGGRTVATPAHVNEGEGDFLVLAHAILAGTGFRTSIAAHVEAAEVLDRPVVSLELVDPRFYHLDTALAVLDDELVAYHPPAFSPGSRAVLAHLFPDAILVGDDDAAQLGLNAVSDGEHVIHAPGAATFAAQVRERGLTPIGVDTSELLKGGGGAKCCTLEVREAEVAA